MAPRLLALVLPLCLAVRDSDVDLNNSTDVPGTHVCCLEVNAHEGTWGFNVYHEKATKEINACKVTLLSEVNCGDKLSCQHECKDRMEKNARYHEVVGHFYHKVWTNKMAPFMQHKEAAKDEHTVKMESIRSKYEAELLHVHEAKKAAEMARDEAKVELDRKEKELEDIEREMEELQRRVEAKRQETQKVKEEIAPLEAEAARSAEDYKAAEEVAKKDYDSSREEAEKVFFDELRKVDEEMGNVEAEKKVYEDYVASLTFQEMPAGCEGDRDCCCVLQGAPVRVNLAFEDWDHCVRAVPFSKTKGFGKTCKPFKDCSKCRKALCGKEMC